MALALLLSSGTAKAQAFSNLAATDYWRSYLEHAHAYADDVPLVPHLGEGSTWSHVKEMLMPGHRKAHSLYLLGDDRLHLFPTRVGVLGWGVNAGLQF